MLKNTQAIIFSTVTIIAFTLVGYFFYSAWISVPSKSMQTPKNSAANTPAPPPAVLSGPEKEAFNFYYQRNASPEDTKKHEALVKSIAVASSVITISNGCVLNPAVLKVQLGDSVTVANSDTTSHTIGRPLSFILKIAPGSSKSFSVKNSLEEEGIYQYSCDNKGIAGIFLVTH